MTTLMRFALCRPTSFVTVLQMLALGLGNKEIAEQMLLSHKTISTYKTRLKEKLRMSSVVHLSKFAQRNHLI